MPTTFQAAIQTTAHCRRCNNLCNANDSRYLAVGYCPDCYSYGDYFQCEHCHNHFSGYDRGASENVCYNCHHAIVCWDATPVVWDGKTTELKSSRRFGIELETSECPSHTRLRGKTAYGSKFDCSVSGMEFVSPILQGDRGLWTTRGFCTRAKHKGFKVDSDCGFHLHLDVSNNTDLQRRHIACAYAHTQAFWHKLVNQYRAHDCDYCHSLDWGGPDMVTAYNFQRFCRNQPRYSWFNVYAFDQHGTFEIRLHEGTLDSKRICNWTKAHLRFADFVQDLKFRQIETMFCVSERQMWQNVTHTWADPTLSRYFRRVALDLAS
jgi:hypothetical protein